MSNLTVVAEGHSRVSAQLKGQLFGSTKIAVRISQRSVSQHCSCTCAQHLSAQHVTAQLKMAPAQHTLVEKGRVTAQLPGTDCCRHSCLRHQRLKGAARALAALCHMDADALRVCFSLGNTLSSIIMRMTSPAHASARRRACLCRVNTAGK